MILTDNWKFSRWLNSFELITKNLSSVKKITDIQLNIAKKLIQFD